MPAQPKFNPRKLMEKAIEVMKQSRANRSHSPAALRDALLPELPCELRVLAADQLVDARA